MTSVQVSLAHVYGFDYSYGDDATTVPGDWPSVREGLPTLDDRIEVWVGPVPEAVTEGHRLGLAQWVATTFQYASPSLDWNTDVDQSILDQAANVPPVKDLTEGFGFWVTVRVVHPCEVEDDLIVPDRKFVWLDAQTMNSMTDSFPNEVGPALESTAAAVLDLFPGPYRRVHTSRVMFETEGRSPAFGDFALIGGLKLALRQRPEDFPRAQLDTALGDLSVPTEKTQLHVLHWLTALTDEADPWKRFIWAMAGLEMVIQSLAKRVKAAVTAQLEYPPANTADLSPIVKELIWPADSDRARREDRSATFHFAVSALGAYPTKAVEDIAEFKDLWEARGKLAHGGGRVTAPPPAKQAEDLFRRYAAALLRQDRCELRGV